MKKQLFTIRKGMYSSILTVSFLLTTVLSSFASGNSDSLNKAAIKYVGKSDKYLTFNVGFKNNEQRKFIVQLVDKKTNDVLYEKEYKDSSFTKNIYLLVENEDCTVTFRIKSGKKLYEQSFNINNEMKYVDDLMVTKL